MIENDSSLRLVITMAMRPLVRILLRRGVTFTSFIAILRTLYVEVAHDEFEIDGRKQSNARIALLTGLNRREVKKVLDERMADDATDPPLKNNRAAQLLSGWLHDLEFRDPKGQPRTLSIADTGPISFQGLVKKYGGDIPWRPFLDELLRVGAVEIVFGDIIKLVSTGYIPSASDDELLYVSFQSVADLLSTIDYNHQNRSNNVSRLQLSVQYDNVTEMGMEIFRDLSREKSKELILYLDQFLATQDRDVNKSATGLGSYRTGLSVFYFEENIQQPDSNHE